jgi:hypothetical protein
VVNVCARAGRAATTATMKQSATVIFVTREFIIEHTPRQDKTLGQWGKSTAIEEF